MIKVFRHIRRSLIQNNQMGKYFKYAIGEILLVVIGILIALYINSSYNAYSEKKVELTILKNLASDIESDYNQLKTVDSLNQLYLKKVSTFKDAIVKNNEVVLKTMINEQYGGAQFLDINPRATTFDEMVNSGKLYTLSNENLTDLCIDYYEAIDKYSNSLLQVRKEYRALFFGPNMTDYWLIYLEETKDKNSYIDAFLANKESTAYKTLKQGSGWGELIMQNTDKAINSIKQENRTLYERIVNEIEIQSND